MKLSIVIAAAVLALAACADPETGATEPEVAPSQTGTWVRDVWAGLSDLSGEELYDEFCSGKSAYFDMLGSPARTMYEGEFDREQFARDQVEEMRADPVWQTTFSGADRSRMVDAVLAAGRRAC